MKNANLPILLLVIVAVAITAQLTRHRGEKPEWQRLRTDMVSSLTRLWEREGHQVELLPASKGVEAPVSVSMPRGLRLRQQRWNHPFLRFVAARHPAVTLGNLQITEAGTDRTVPEVAMTGLLADRVAPRVNFADEEERLCQLTARQLTSALQRELGVRLLVLVDAQQARSSSDGSVYGAPDPQPMGLMAKPVEITRVMVTEVCVVGLEGQVSSTAWEHFRAENPLGGARYRLVTLP